MDDVGNQESRDLSLRELKIEKHFYSGIQHIWHYSVTTLAIMNLND